MCCSDQLSPPLFADVAATPALDSNGLRALIRLGYCDEGRSYDQSYRSGVAALTREGLMDAATLKQAYLVLRDHGRALCKRSAPICAPCPLDAACAHRMAS